MVCGNICVMTSSPTPEQIAKMDADQLQAMLLGQIKANSVLQVEALELRASNINLQAVNAELQVVVSTKTLSSPRSPSNWRFTKGSGSARRLNP